MTAASRRVLAQGRHLRFVEEDGWEFVERNAINGVVVIVAVTAEGRLVLVEQYRRPVGTTVLELPAGLSGDVVGQEDEDLASAARRELLEETGYDAGSLERIGPTGPPSAGVTSEVVTFFRAQALRRVGPGGGDAHEQITVHEIPLAEVEAWLEERARAGALVDPKVYAGLYFASRS